MLRKTLLPLIFTPFFVAVPAFGEVIERVIVKVNGEIVTLTELQARQYAAFREAQIPIERVDDFLRENNQKIFQEAIDDLLIAQRSAEIDGDIPEEQLTQAVQGIKKDFGIENEDDFERALQQEGMTRDELKRNVARSILTRRFFVREVEPKVKVSEADARAYYESRKNTDYSLPASVELQEILLPTEKGEAAAREIVARVRAGEDFEQLARAHSVASTASSGGQLGRVTRRDLNAELARLIDALEPGQTSDPLVTRTGFQILKLISRSEERIVPFSEVKDKIIHKLSQERQDAVLEKILAKLRKDAIIEDMVREVPLQVSAPAASSSLRDVVSGAATSETPAPSSTDEEFSVTPMDQPQRRSMGAETSPSPENEPQPQR